MRAQEIIRVLLLKGYTENWIAKQAHIAQSTVHRLKVGDSRYPRYDTVEKLHKIYQQHVKLEGNHAA